MRYYNNAATCSFQHGNETLFIYLAQACNGIRLPLPPPPPPPPPLSLPICLACSMFVRLNNYGNAKKTEEDYGLCVGLSHDGLL